MTNQEIREKLALLEKGELLPADDQTRALKDLLRANNKLIALRQSTQPAPIKVNSTTLPFRRGA